MSSSERPSASLRPSVVFMPRLPSGQSSGRVSRQPSPTSTLPPDCPPDSRLSVGASVLQPVVGSRRPSVRRGVVTLRRPSARNSVLPALPGSALLRRAIDSLRTRSLAPHSCALLEHLKPWPVVIAVDLRRPPSARPSVRPSDARTVRPSARPSSVRRLVSVDTPLYKFFWSEGSPGAPACQPRPG